MKTIRVRLQATALLQVPDDYDEDAIDDAVEEIEADVECWDQKVNVTFSNVISLSWEPES